MNIETNRKNKRVSKRKKKTERARKCARSGENIKEHTYIHSRDMLKLKTKNFMIYNAYTLYKWCTLYTYVFCYVWMCFSSVLKNKHILCAHAYIYNIKRKQTIDQQNVTLQITTIIRMQKLRRERNKNQDKK